MPSLRTASNPFALMTHPHAVVAAMEASDRLRALRRRVCRPLDRVGTAGAASLDDASDVADEGDAAAWGDDDASPVASPS